MKYNDIENQLKQLRVMWTKEVHQREEIEQRARELKHLKDTCFGCYECDEVVLREKIPFMFCSEEHHEKWAQANYGRKNENGKPRLTIDQMREKLREMAKEERLNKIRT